MSGGEGPRGAMPLQAAPRPEPGFQPPAVGLDRVVRVPAGALYPDPRTGPSASPGDLGQRRHQAARTGPMTGRIRSHLRLTVAWEQPNRSPASCWVMFERISAT